MLRTIPFSYASCTPALAAPAHQITRAFRWASSPSVYTVYRHRPPCFLSDATRRSLRLSNLERLVCELCGGKLCRNLTYLPLPPKQPPRRQRHFRFRLQPKRLQRDGRA